MSKLVERAISQTFQGDHYSVTKLKSGLSNEIYRATHPGRQKPSVAVTIMTEPESWWKVDQARTFYKAIGANTDVLIPKLVNAGFDSVGNQEFAFLIREYVEGRELHDVFARSALDYKGDADQQDIARDLGHRLAVLHSCSAPAFGYFATVSPYTPKNWESHISAEIQQSADQLSRLPEDKFIGEVGTRQLTRIIPPLLNELGSLNSLLVIDDSPSIAHGDAHFRNVIIDNESSGRWQVTGLIDTEEAIGGDPEIDLAFIENWLHMFPYKQKFYDQRTELSSGYQEIRRVSEQYPTRRLIYHALRSLSYLNAIFSIENLAVSDLNPDIELYVKRHFQIVQSLSRGHALEDLNIPSII